MDESRRRMVIAHELAHVRRLDCLADVFARVVRALHWYNPLVWFALRRLCVEREAACDAWVLRLGYAPSAYAETLVTIARATTHPRLLQAAGLAMARSSHVTRRVKQILQPVVSTRGYVGLSVMVVVAFVVVFGALAGVRVSGAQPVATPQRSGLGHAQPDVLEVHIAPGDDAESFPRVTLNRLPYAALRQSGIDASTFYVKDGIVYSLEIRTADDFARLVQAAAASIDLVTLIIGAADTPVGAFVQVMDALKAAGVERVQVRGDANPGAAGGDGSIVPQAADLSGAPGEAKNRDGRIA